MHGLSSVSSAAGVLFHVLKEWGKCTVITSSPCSEMDTFGCMHNITCFAMHSMTAISSGLLIDVISVSYFASACMFPNHILCMCRQVMFDGVHADIIHSSQPQAQRNAAVDNFRAGNTWLLIATDLVGRGMDFLGIHTVINYDFPQSTTDYIHRVGRTGRAGRTGIASVLCVHARHRLDNSH